jgi:hypothetical protein
LVERPPLDQDLAARSALTTELHRALASRILARWTGTAPARRTIDRAAPQQTPPAR